MDIPQLPNEILCLVAELADNDTMYPLSITASVFRKNYQRKVTKASLGAEFSTSIDKKWTYGGVFHGPMEYSDGGKHTFLRYHKNYLLGMEHGRNVYHDKRGTSEFYSEDFWFHDKKHGPHMEINIYSRSITSWRHGVKHGVELSVDNSTTGLLDTPITCKLWNLGVELPITSPCTFIGPQRWQFWEAYYTVSNAVEYRLDVPIVKYAYDAPRLPVEILYIIMEYADPALMRKLSITSPIFRRRIEFLSSQYPDMAEFIKYKYHATADDVFNTFKAFGMHTGSDSCKLRCEEELIDGYLHGTVEKSVRVTDDGYASTTESWRLGMLHGRQTLYCHLVENDRTEGTCYYHFGRKHGPSVIKKTYRGRIYDLAIKSWRHGRKHGACVRYTNDGPRVRVFDRGIEITDDLPPEEVYIKPSIDIHRAEEISLGVEKYLSSPVIKNKLTSA